MSKYEELKQVSCEHFRRLTGVKPGTFEKMTAILSKAEDSARQSRRRKAGKRSRMSVEDRLLMALEYLREYRTYFHLGRSYGLSESACYRACRWVEDTLIKSGEFSLPGKKELLKRDVEYEVILIDATESPIERPKKKSKKQETDKKA
jgi:hypothetical protein